MDDLFERKGVKLKLVSNDTFNEELTPMLLPHESIIASFKSARDGVVFTDKRIFSIDVQGLSGKKIRYSSYPYSKIQTFSVETAGLFDIDSELDLFFSGMGHIKFEFTTRTDVPAICRMISEKVL